MSTYIEVQGELLHVAHLASSLYPTVYLLRTIQSSHEACSLQVFFIPVVKFLAEVVLIPLEVFEEDETPPLIQVDQSLNFLQNLIQFGVEFSERQYFEGLLLTQLTEYFIHGLLLTEVVGFQLSRHFLFFIVLLLVVLVLLFVVVFVLLHCTYPRYYNQARLEPSSCWKISTPMHIQIKDVFKLSDQWIYLVEIGGLYTILMDLDWLWLIIPGGYLAISTFFLCLPNILHRRQRYHYDAFNQLVQSSFLFCIGHRGGAFEGPENTLQVFKATSKVSHMFELDICVTKDGKLVVHHDTNLKRTCGVDKLINELNSDQLPTMAEEYESFGGGGVIKTQRNKLLFLEELFEHFPEMPMNIDLKTPTDVAIAEFDRLVRKFKREHITVWGAIDSSRNQRMRQVNPEVVNFYSTTQILKIFFLTITGLLPFVCLRQGVLDIPLVTAEMKNMGYKAVGSGCKKCLCVVIFALFSFFNLISRLFIPHLKKRGILTFYWIVNDEEDFDSAISMGCSGIMTDLPSRLARHLKSSSLYFQGSSTSL